MKFAKDPGRRRCRNRKGIFRISCANCFSAFLRDRALPQLFGSCKKSCWLGAKKKTRSGEVQSVQKALAGSAKEIIAKNLRATRSARRKLIKMLTAKTLVCVGRFHYGQRRARMARNLVVVLVAQFFGHCERYTKQAACVSRS